ncbi:uncharacterized protein LOC141902595 [Tubulanus polymorphus]|uniref:uncharacterized protein LOC141902595 n=1 Tax=Tubulanus polymorphus TaxID=672921 RepID=UPI003DA3DD81
MPRSFLVKKIRSYHHHYRDDRIYIKEVPDTPPSPDAPLSECQPPSPTTPPTLLQPLTVRISNGYIHDVLHSTDQHIRRDSTEVNSSHESGSESDLPSSCGSSVGGSDISHDDVTRPHHKSNKFQDGITVGYTYDAFFITDGRSRARRASPEKPRQRYTCNECGKTYATSSNLSRHKQTHRSLDSQLAKKCPHCDKVYVSMPALSMHILTHSLKHECPKCGKSFSRPWLLQGHLRSHTGEKPFGCAHCGKAFADRSNLRAHMQTHSAFKHYTCKRCNKSFALKSYLNKHYESACFKDDGQVTEKEMDSGDNKLDLSDERPDRGEMSD